jgi:hypothetical protein
MALAYRQLQPPRHRATRGRGREIGSMNGTGVSERHAVEALSDERVPMHELHFDCHVLEIYFWTLGGADRRLNLRDCANHPASASRC